MRGLGGVCLTEGRPFIGAGGKPPVASQSDLHGPRRRNDLGHEPTCEEYDGFPGSATRRQARAAERTWAPPVHDGARTAPRHCLTEKKSEFRFPAAKTRRERQITSWGVSALLRCRARKRSHAARPTQRFAARGAGRRCGPDLGPMWRQNPRGKTASVADVEGRRPVSRAGANRRNLSGKKKHRIRVATQSCSAQRLHHGPMLKARSNGCGGRSRWDAGAGALRWFRRSIKAAAAGDGSGLGVHA